MKAMFEICAHWRLWKNRIDRWLEKTRGEQPDGREEE